MDDALGQRARPGLFQVIQFSRKQIARACLQFVRSRFHRRKQRPPAGNRESVRAGHCKARTGEVHRGERPTDNRAMLNSRPSWPDPFQKLDDRCRSAGQRAESFAVAGGHWLHATQAVRREMRHQIEEEW